jgi:hypothetical protein
LLRKGVASQVGSAGLRTVAAEGVAIGASGGAQAKHRIATPPTERISELTFMADLPTR